MMTSSHLIFDRLAYVTRLTQAGVSEDQARAQADALDAALRDGVATNAEVRVMLSEIKVELIKWMIGTGLGVIAALKLLH